MLTQVLSTYRIQFHSGFKFDDAGELTDYLQDLGISHIYASPVFRARKNSAHGYDITDPLSLNPDLGSEKSFDGLLVTLRQRNIGWIQDIVPNHMAYDRDNRMLMDIMENGRSSRFFHYFDFFWNHPDESLRGRILAPFLGKPYGETLETGEIRLAYDSDGFSINYYESRYPVCIESYSLILGRVAETLKETMSDNDSDYVKFLGILYVIKSVNDNAESDQRANQIVFVKKILKELYAGNPLIREKIDNAIKDYNGNQGEPETYSALDELLNSQYYRLAYWRVANQELNYKRFFNINGLISIKIQNEDVFRETHSLIAKLIGRNLVDGLRVDHIDGLYDPEEYLKRLRSLSPEIYIVVEKILENDEHLPAGWPVEGTTGYDYLNYANGLFCHKKRQKEFSKLYADFIGEEIHFSRLVYDKKKIIIEKQLTGDLDNLANLLKRIANKYRHGRDITLNGLRKGMVEILAHFPVYRTYISGWEVGAEDRRIIVETINKAKYGNPEYETEIKLIEKFLLLDFFEEFTREERNDCVDFVMKFQRLTGPLMAKGFEDTSLYIFNRLISMNEVGGDPVSFGVSIQQFHDFCTARLQRSPRTMNASSTHDTKRGEDVRARINVLSEIPREWRRHLKRWNTVNKKYKRILDGKAVPDSNEEYVIYQTLLGMYPFIISDENDVIPRLENYIVKFLREAKIHSNWDEPDIEYEDAVKGFIRDITDLSQNGAFMKEFLSLHRLVSHFGMLNSLSQTLIKLTVPGIPDFYQGTELWDLSLVDPDNRRPVDFELRKKLLAEIVDRSNREDVFDYIADLRNNYQDGKIKMFLTYKTLMARREHPDVFLNGEYAPLRVTGKYRDHLIAFSRTNGNTISISIAPRLLCSIMEEEEFPLGKKIWGDTSIYLPNPGNRIWGNALTGETISRGGRVSIADILTSYPTALLISRDKQ